MKKLFVITFTAIPLTIAALMITPSIHAQVLEVTIWKTGLGATNAIPRMFERGLQAKAIQEKHGATVTVGRDMHNQMHFATSHKDWVSWNKYWTSMTEAKAMDQFWLDVNKEPADGEVVEHYLINMIATGNSGEVYEVYIWEPVPGRASDLYDAGLRAKAIHDKSGTASAGVGIDRLGRMHYVLNYPSWEAYAKLHDTPNAEYDAFYEQEMKNPAGKLIKVYTASNQ